MGTNSSRTRGNVRRRPRRRMADQGNDDDHDDGGSDQEMSLAEVLSYLVRSGQVRISQTDNLDDDDSEYSNHGDDDDDFFGSAEAPQEITKPDTNVIENSAFSQELMLHTGRCCAHRQYYKHNVARTLPSLLIQREWGGVKRKLGFTHGDCCSMSSAFLPNYKTVVARYYHKAFCGVYSKSGNFFITASQDQNIRIYDTASERFSVIKSVRARDVGWSVLDIAFSPDETYLAYSSWSDCIHLCGINEDHDTHISLPMCPGEHSFCIFSLAFSADNTEILGGANDGNLYVYDREVDRRTLKIDAHEDDVNAVAFADDSTHILFSGGDDGLCKVWDRRSLREANPVPVGVLSGHCDGITHIDSKGDARYLISNSKDQSIKLWDMRVFSPREGQEATRNMVSSQRWDYRWQKVPKAMYGKRTKLRGDTSLLTYRGHCVLHTLIRARFSPDFVTGQRFIYSGCATGAVVIYDTLTGQIVSKLDEHAHCVRDAYWHPYDNIILSTSWDGTIGKWQYKSQEAFSDTDDSGLSDEDDDSDSRQGNPRRSRRLQAKRRQERACGIRRMPRVVNL